MYMGNIKVPVIFLLQIFTNADEAHVAQVLSRLGLEDCFQGVICFETLNPHVKPVESIDGVIEELAQDATDTKKIDNLSVKAQILCKPSVEAMEAAIHIANVDPKRTVKYRKHLFDIFDLTAHKTYN